jgi:hypothetical protein
VAVQGIWDRQETWEPREHRVSKVLLVHRDQLAIVGPQDRVAPPVLLDLLDLLATADNQDLQET